MTDTSTAHHIGRYRVLSYIGQGGMAEVFKCQLKGIGGFDKIVVIKRILPELSHDPQFVQMFLDEARLAALLNHANIIQVFEVDEDDGLPYIVMEHGNGPTLRQIMYRLAKEGRIHFGHIARIIGGVALGLDHAHNATLPDGRPLGLVHRDISPHNIIVTMDGVAKLLDFGVAKAEGRLARTQTGGFKGKLEYTAPERLTGAEATPASDIYSLGVTLYHATVGASPYRAEAEAAMLLAIVNGDIRKPTDRIPDYPEELERIVLSAMHPDPAQRCPSARSLHAMLEPFFERTSKPKEFVSWLGELFPTEESYSEAKAPPYGSSPSSRRSGSGSGSAPSYRSVGGGGAGSSPSTPSLVTGGYTIVPERRVGWPLVVGVVAAGAVLAAAAVIGLSMSQREPAPVAQVPAGPSPADLAATMKSYLDEAERLAEAHKYAPALELLDKAEQVKADDAALQIRLTRVRDEIEQTAHLKIAEHALERGDREKAIESAKRVLDRDFDNAAAKALLARARSTGEEEPKEGSAATTSRHGEANSKRSTRKASASTTARGKVTITATPDAVVYVDEEPLGKTPLVADNLEAGSHLVEVRAEGYQPQTRTVRVKSGSSQAVSFQLVKTESERGRISELVAEGQAADKPAVVAQEPASPPAAAQPSAPPAKADVPPPTTTPAPASAPAIAATAPPASQSYKPRLPEKHTVRSAKELARSCRIIEQEVIAGGGPAAGVNDATYELAALLAKKIGPTAPITIYPRAMYYLILEASRRGTPASAVGSALVEAHTSGKLASR